MAFTSQRVHECRRLHSTSLGDRYVPGHKVVAEDRTNAAKFTVNTPNFVKVDEPEGMVYLRLLHERVIATFLLFHFTKHGTLLFM